MDFGVYTKMNKTQHPKEEMNPLDFSNSLSECLSVASFVVCFIYPGSNETVVADPVQAQYHYCPEALDLSLES